MLLRTRSKIILFIGTSLAAVTIAPGAFAQAAPSTSDTPEIVVSAEKRDISLQKAPLSISALSSQSLNERNVNELNHLNGLVPGLTIAANEGAERIIAIRGIGYETPQAPNTQPGVAFHIDGVYISHPIALGQDLIDVDHVEVLRGPQGTVFGQASTGGAINVITKQPQLNAVGGDASLSYGNYNSVKAQSAINLPLGDTWALRVSGQYLRHDGYAKETLVPGTNGNYPVDDANRGAVRGALLWQPTSTFSAELSGQYFLEDNNSAAQKNALDPDPDPRRLSQDFPGKFRLQTAMGTLVLKQQFPWADLVSTTSRQQMYHAETAANDRSAFSIAGYFDHLVLWHDVSHSWTEELTLTSKGESRLKWIVGGFFLYQDAVQEILEYKGTDPQTPLPVILTDPSVVPGSFILPHDLQYQTNSPYQHRSFAGYGQATYSIFDTLRIAGGLRYSDDKTSAQPETLFNAFGITPPSSIKGHILTGKVELEYDLAAMNMVYLSYSTGYKPGGLNFGNPGLVVSGPIQHEFVRNFEIGSKNRFFDNKLTLNASGYYMAYKNFQVLSDDPILYSYGVTNIPDAHLWGGEFEASYAIVKGLRLDGNLALEGGKFIGDYFILDDTRANQIRTAAATFYGLPYASAAFIPAVIAETAAAEENTNGKRPPKLPAVTGSAALTYSHDLASGKITAQANLVYRGKFDYRVFNDSALDTVPSYTTVGLYLQYDPTNSHWRLSLTATNLFNVSGVNSRFTDAYGSGTTSAQYIAPRQVLGTVGYKF